MHEFVIGAQQERTKFYRFYHIGIRVPCIFCCRKPYSMTSQLQTYQNQYIKIMYATFHKFKLHNLAGLSPLFSFVRLILYPRFVFFRFSSVPFVESIPEVAVVPVCIVKHRENLLNELWIKGDVFTWIILWILVNGVSEVDRIVLIT